MNDFTVHRNHRGHLVGISICGFRVDSWQQLEGVANSLIKEHPDSWAELYLDAEELKVELQNDCKALYENQIAENTKLAAQIIAVSDKARDRISAMRAEVKQEIKAVTMILSSIKDSQSSHWQKKENIRLCLEILDKIPTFDRGEFFNYEDDF